MRKVFFQGTFDPINLGHIRAFELAKSKGDYLIVGVNSDSLIRWFKKRIPGIPDWERVEILKRLPIIDEVIVCDKPQAIDYLKGLNCLVYVLTEEWAEAQKEAIDWLEDNGGEVVFSPRWDDISDGTTIRKRYIEGGK